MENTTLESYRLSERVDNLPHRVREAIRQEIKEFTGNNNNWSNIMRGLRTDLYFREVRVLCKHIGCTLDELANPSADLAEIYRKTRQSATEEDFASQVGLQPS